MAFWKRKKDDIAPQLKAELDQIRPIIYLMKDGERLAKAGRFDDALSRFAEAGQKITGSISPSMSDMLRGQIYFGMAMAYRGLGNREWARRMLRNVQEHKFLKEVAFALGAKMDAEDGAYVDSVEHYLDALDAVSEALPEMEEARRAGLDVGHGDTRQFIAMILSELAESAGWAGVHSNVMSEGTIHRIAKLTTLPLLNYAWTWVARVLQEQHHISKQDAGVISAQVTNAWAHEPVDYNRLTPSMRETAEQVIRDPGLIGGPIPLVAQVLAAKWLAKGNRSTRPLSPT